MANSYAGILTVHGVHEFKLQQQGAFPILATLLRLAEVGGAGET
jgi:hypothetical protein